MSEREKVEIINVWAVNDINADEALTKFLNSLSPENQSSAISAIKQAYIVGFKKALQITASHLGTKGNDLAMANKDSAKEYDYANEILKIGTQLV